MSQKRSQTDNKKNSTESSTKSAPKKTNYTASKVKPILCNQFNVKNLSFTELTDNDDKTRAQFMAFSRYKYPAGEESSLVLQTGEIEITQYGLPSIGKYYKTDDQRNFVKLALDPKQASCRELEKTLSEIDTMAEKEKVKILGKYSNPKLGYTYQAIVREPSDGNDFDKIEDDEEDSEKKEAPKDANVKERFRYCKIKLNTSYPDGEVLTRVFIKNRPQEGETGKQKPESVTVRSATDLDKYLRWGCKVRMILMLNKIWAARNKNEAGVRKYGATWKVMQMEIIPTDKKSSMKDAFESYAFDNEDDEENNENESNEKDDKDTTDTKNKNTKESKETKDKKVETKEDSDEPADKESKDKGKDDEEDGSVDESEDSASGSEEDEEPEEKEPPKQTKQVKTAAKTVTRKK